MMIMFREFPGDTFAVLVVDTESFFVPIVTECLASNYPGFPVDVFNGADHPIYGWNE